MNIYSILILILAVVILMSRMTHGFKKGFIHEVDAMFSMLAAAVCLSLLAGSVSGLIGASLSNFFIGLVLLAVVCVLYKIFHILFSSIGIIVKLPVIRWLDRAMGLLIGLVEGFIILYVLQYLLEHYLLV